MVQYNQEILCNNNEYIEYTRATISFHAAARDYLADSMKGDWLLMLDTDHQFDPDIAHRMLNIMNSADIDVLIGVYVHHGPPHAPVLYHWPDEGFPRVIGGWEQRTDAVIRADTAGAGCLMVRKSVFDRIKETDQSPFAIIPPWGEDHSFFLRLKKLGIPSYFDPNIECPHLNVEPKTLDDFFKYKLPVEKNLEVEGVKWQ